MKSLVITIKSRKIVKRPFGRKIVKRNDTQKDRKRKYGEMAKTVRFRKFFFCAYLHVCMYTLVCVFTSVSL